MCRASVSNMHSVYSCAYFYLTKPWTLHSSVKSQHCWGCKNTKLCWFSVYFFRRVCQRLIVAVFVLLAMASEIHSIDYYVKYLWANMDLVDFLSMSLVYSPGCERLCVLPFVCAVSLEVPLCIWGVCFSLSVIFIHGFVQQKKKQKQL